MYRSILVPVDLGQPSSWRAALPTAAELCRAFDARLTLATVVPDWRWLFEDPTLPVAFDSYIDRAYQSLRAVALRVTGVGEVALGVEIGSICRGILAVAHRSGADLIVMASHRPEMTDYLLGANASRVVRHADCSVLVVRDASGP